jgi:hypothetical protein
MVGIPCGERGKPTLLFNKMHEKIKREKGPQNEFPLSVEQPICNQMCSKHSSSLK